jgi:hypothetical protein
MSKLYIGNTEAQKSNYERALDDKEKVHKFASHEVRDKWGLRFKAFTTLIFFRSEEQMKEKKEHYETLYGTAKVIKPKFKKK